MKQNRLAVASLSLLVAAALAHADVPAAPAPSAKDFFYVFASKDKHEMPHYAPSGWMGDTGDLKYEEVKDVDNTGATYVKILYSAKGSKGAGWAGIYWQNPNNNWGARAGGFNLSKFKKLTFMAKGAIGGEKISAFKVGGISGDFGDTDSADTGPIELTNAWKTYAIDLTGKDLSRIIGGFCFSASRDDNPNGFTFYLNDIRYEP